MQRVRWYEAREDAETLPFESIIYRREWDNDEYQPIPVGEVSDAQKKFKAGFVPPGLGAGHYCGTETDFAEGGEYLPDVEPAKYGASGWPLCCNPIPVVKGGAGGGAHVTIGPPVVVPGWDCADSYRYETGVTYEFFHPGGSNVFAWFYSLEAFVQGTQLHCTMTSTQPTQRVLIRHSTPVNPCTLSAGDYEGAIGASSCAQFTVIVGFTNMVSLRFGGFLFDPGPGWITFRLDPGPCP